MSLAMSLQFCSSNLPQGSGRRAVAFGPEVGPEGQILWGGVDGATLPSNLLGPQPAYGAASPSKVADFAGSVCIPSAKAKGSKALLAVAPSLCCIISAQACNVCACEAPARRVVTLVIEAALHKLST